jgi:hypothetical protein
MNNKDLLGMYTVTKVELTGDKKVLMDIFSEVYDILENEKMRIRGQKPSKKNDTIVVSIIKSSSYIFGLMAALEYQDQSALRMIAIMKQEGPLSNIVNSVPLEDSKKKLKGLLFMIPILIKKLYDSEKKEERDEETGGEQRLLRQLINKDCYDS